MRQEVSKVSKECDEYRPKSQEVVKKTDWSYTIKSWES